jgi:hypothetical protein
MKPYALTCSVELATYQRAAQECKQEFLVGETPSELRGLPLFQPLSLTGSKAYACIWPRSIWASREAAAYEAHISAKPNPPLAYPRLSGADELGCGKTGSFAKAR